MAIDSTPLLSLIGPSGLDTGAIIDALAGVRRTPILRLEAQRAKLQRQSTEFGTLRTRLDALRTKAMALDSAAEMRAFKATSSLPEVLTANASNASAEGTWNITVNSLATAQSEMATGVSARTGVAIGSGTIRISSGGVDYDVAIDAGADLEAVRNAFNASGAPVHASIIDDGSGGADAFKLVLTSTKTGLAGGFTVDASGFTPDAGTFDFTTLSGAEDASISVNGLLVSRPTNTVTDLIDGLSITLLQAGQTATVTVSKDVDAIKAKVKDLVTAFNDVIDLFKTHSNAELKNTTAVLYGDTTLRSAQTALRSIIDGQVPEGNDYATLFSIGIKTGADGKLSVDDAKLTAALEADTDGVIGLFTTAATGVAPRVTAAVDSLINNSIKTRTDGIQARIRGINQNVDRLEERLEKYIEMLRKKYAALDTLAGRLQSQGGALSALENL